MMSAENASRPGGPRSPDLGGGHCIICMDDIQEKRTLEKCMHSFCASCISEVFKLKPACPICNTFYGAYFGTQPHNGSMKVTRSWEHLPGFESCGTIVIDYHFPAGIQEAGHPNPGQLYAGTSRRAFLPASEEGERVLRLLRRAFTQRLLFTVGTSATTGRSNVITWNDIHHKTNMHGGPQCFGYPDPGYLLRVQEELRLKGVTEDDLSEPVDGTYPRES
ncbi:probable E3 ubiquitin-protein ligase DTX3 [Anguilla rostrata]|uniref:probable E3 ubiquitin-protein ligase DTX3 n=1 Tax=Anguilla rostrata TaxID=7938 RepID=UPI0030CE278A